MRNLLYAIESSNVVQRVDTGRKAAVKAEDLVIDEGSEGKIVEEVCKVLPDVGIAVFAKTLVVESVNLGDLTRLVVSSEDGDALGIADFEGNEEGDGLHRVVSAINIISYRSHISLPEAQCDRGRHAHE